MWDDKNYNLEYPKEFKNCYVHRKSRILKSRWKTSNYYTRIFKINKNHYHYIINHNKKLHFRLIPESYKNERIGITDLQILHVSTNTPEKRKIKYEKYIDNDVDKSQKNYQHFLRDDPITNEFVPIC